MKVCITTPSFAPHGGIRIILEIANRLRQWHEVVLYCSKPATCTWFNLDRSIRIVSNQREVAKCDLLIITSPHDIHLQKNPPLKKVIFQQMMEHLFRPHDQMWFNQCKEFYTTKYPVLTTGQWNKEENAVHGRKHKTHVIGQGINTQNFPISKKKKDEKTVLVEAWECTNPAKDIDYIAPRVAGELRRQGYRIIAYSSLPLHHYKNIPNEFHVRPSLAKLNEIYERATIMLKASRYDDRALAPIEAMTKGTVTARAITKGDADLVHMHNCLRSEYEETLLLDNAMKLLKNSTLKIYEGFPHGMCTTHADVINAALLAFIKG